ncbi:MAG: TetR/AcrR family transcriptional regulator [Actinomycetota bacterium]|nr:TetR/AcrR family transcriptional regulator [Actinomycetota bacterium]
MAKSGTRQPAQRADARRNVTAILDAALRCLSRNADASVAEIAQTAGVGRVTLYGHFPSRAELVDAVLTRAIEEGNQTLEAVDLSGDPRGALDRLVGSSWLLVNEFRSLLVAAQAALPPGRIRELHAGPAARVEGLVDRGRAEGVFRTDLPTSWLVGTAQNIMHGAADEINAGRLDPDDAATAISAILLAAFTPPGQPVPSVPASSAS